MVGMELIVWSVDKLNAQKRKTRLATVATENYYGWMSL
jgi:hypothetical protein